MVAGCYFDLEHQGDSNVILIFSNGSLHFRYNGKFDVQNRFENQSQCDLYIETAEGLGCELYQWSKKYFLEKRGFS